jgi:hydrogenase small subunit
MTGILVSLLTFDKVPDLDSAGRPKVFYRQRVHDKCERRASFDAGRFVEAWGDEGARNGWCLYKMGCRGPVTFNACSTTKWNGGVSTPIGAGHGCLGCSQPGCWDEALYQRLPLYRLREGEASASLPPDLDPGAARKGE